MKKKERKFVFVFRFSVFIWRISSFPSSFSMYICHLCICIKRVSFEIFTVTKGKFCHHLPHLINTQTQCRFLFSFDETATTLVNCSSPKRIRVKFDIVPFEINISNLIEICYHRIRDTHFLYIFAYNQNYGFIKNASKN